MLNQSINLCRLMPCAYCCCDRGCCCWWLLSGCVWFVLWYVCLSVCLFCVTVKLTCARLVQYFVGALQRLWFVEQIRLKHCRNKTQSSVHCSSYYGFLHVWYHYVTSVITLTVLGF